jgi:hypothetical protein
MNAATFHRPGRRLALRRPIVRARPGERYRSGARPRHAARSTSRCSDRPRRRTFRCPRRRRQVVPSNASTSCRVRRPMPRLSRVSRPQRRQGWLSSSLFSSHLSVAALASFAAMKMALLFCLVFAGGPANIAIYCSSICRLCRAGRVRTIADMSQSRPQILIVDDDEEIRSLLQVVLTREGFHVREAKDAPTARRMLGVQGDMDLIILDIMMPGEDGLSFCQRLRETAARSIL